MAQVTPEVLDAILAPSTTITRRISIFESDGETPFAPTQGTDLRLVDGGVGVDSGRDERRVLEVTLDNSDGVLNHDPNGFWYDKIIKAYRGISYLVPDVTPRILVIDDLGATTRLKTIYRDLGFADITFNTAATTLADFYGYDIIVSDQQYISMSAPRATLLKSAYDAGYSILTIGNDTTQALIPHLVGASVTKGDAAAWQIVPYGLDNPLASGWTTETGGVDTGAVLTALAGSARPAATWVWSAQTTYPVIYQQGPNGARWVHFQYYEMGTQAKLLHKAALTWLRNYSATATWETELGTFMIDRIDTDNFPRLIKVTGTDYTKKCQLSKLGKATGWPMGTLVVDIVRSVITNAGVVDMSLPSDCFDQLGTDVVFERGTPRWKIAKDLCDSIGYEIFFDPRGIFVMRTFRDPSTSASSMTFRGDELGNMISYKKSSNDSRIYNVVIAAGKADSSMSAASLVYAEARNTEPSSPTRIAVPGQPGGMSERQYIYESSFFTSDQQAQDVANKWLKVMALEEFVLDFEALVFPWLEAGEIIDFIDPETATDFPDRFLLTTLSIPLGLAPMGAQSKRVTVVGSNA